METAYFIDYAGMPSVAAPTVGADARGIVESENRKAAEIKKGASGALHCDAGLSGVDQLYSVVDVSGIRFIASHW
jgi:hypothetical protein